MLCVLHERRAAVMPELAVPLDRSVYAVAHGLDRVFPYQFAVKRWKFLMPAHNLGPVSRGELMAIFYAAAKGESQSL